MQPVFADTFYWVALLHREDASHKAVLEFSRDFASTFVTADEVLTEGLAFRSSDPDLRKEASRAVRRILIAGNVRVIPQSRERFLDGIDLYRRAPIKGYSLADCISMRPCGERDRPKRSPTTVRFRTDEFGCPAGDFVLEDRGVLYVPDSVRSTFSLCWPGARHSSVAEDVLRRVTRSRLFF